jgi:hypothetical protein
MPHILLLGAGFSRNWHGWLASEIGSDLAGRLAGDAHLSGVLRQSKGFEDALSTVQAAYKANPNDQTRAQLMRFQDALQATFASMNDAFATMTDFEFTQDYAYQVVPFLTKFDAIFTLNQDLLLELHYRDRMVIPAHPRWNGCEFPGMTPRPQMGGGLSDARAVIWQPAPQFTLSPNLQPIFKLHGSTNWRDAEGGELLVMGADKAETIREKAILRWYADEFLRYLSMRDARLMVIGYGFLDPHINDAIVTGSKAGGLRMFIVDPAGLKVLRNANPTSTRPVYLPHPIEEVGSLGDSTRALRETFGTDHLEHGKLGRFFSP